MDFFATNDTLVELEEQLSASFGGARLEWMTALAWFIRQSDASRSAALAEEVAAGLSDSDLIPEKQITLQARINLIRGELAWLSMAHNDAENAARRALREFDSAHDHQGCADAHWLLAWLAVDSGNLAQRDLQFRQMAQAAERAADAARFDIAQAALARWSALSDARQTEEQFGAHFQALAKDDNPIRALWSNEFLGILMYCKEDLAQALSFTIQAHKQAVRAGQIYFAIVTAINIAD